MSRNHSINRDEGQALVASHTPKTNVASTILLKTSLYGLRSTVVAIHYLGNGLLMSSLGDDEAAASSVTSTMQTLTIGASSGFLLAVGNLLGESIAANNKSQTSAITRSAFIMTISIGTIVSGIYLGSGNVFELMLKKATAQAAGQFFKGFALAAIPDLLLSTSGQIIFQIDKNPYLPLVSSVVYRGSSLGFAYLLSHTLKLGALGIGLGAGIAGWATVLMLSGWFLRSRYRNLPLWTRHELHFMQCVKMISKPGWKLSLQRITEWANLAILIQIIGAWDNDNLIAAQPSILLLTLCNLLSQGFAAASMMIASNDCKSLSLAIDNYLTQNEPEYIRNLHAYFVRIKKNFLVTSSSALLFNVVLATGLYFARDMIIDLYIPSDTSSAIKSQAKQLFWINMISLIPDSLRITSGGLLRGWGDLLFPTLMSLLIMSIIGIPLSIGASHFIGSGVLTLFIARNLLLLLSAIANYYKVGRHFCSEKLTLLIFSVMELFCEKTSDETEIHTNNWSNSNVVIQYNLTQNNEHAATSNILQLAHQLFGLNVKQKIIQHVYQYQSVYADFITQDIESFLQKESFSIQDAEKILLLLSRSFETTIVFFNSDSEKPTIIRQGASESFICIGFDEQKRFQVFNADGSRLKTAIQQTKMDRLSEKANLRFSQMVQIFRQKAPQQFNSLAKMAFH